MRLCDGSTDLIMRLSGSSAHHEASSSDLIWGYLAVQLMSSWGYLAVQPILWGYLAVQPISSLSYMAVQSISSEGIWQFSWSNYEAIWQFSWSHYEAIWQFSWSHHEAIWQFSWSHAATITLPCKFIYILKGILIWYHNLCVLTIFWLHVIRF